MKLKIAISPCPNDTYIFEKIATKQINLNGYDFEFNYLDIQELNTMAQNGDADIIKISFAQYFSLKNKYTLLPTGGAMGYGVGPILVKKSNSFIDLQKDMVAIPGINTTANFLLQFLYPNIKNKTSILFSDIEKNILSNKVQAGLLIHEGRFTYKDKGLELIADLGSLWEQKTKLPIPLGCIIVKKELGTQVIKDITNLIQNSIPDFEDTIKITPFIQLHAQEMKEEVMLQHIQLYVNNFSKNMGEEGKEVVALMEDIYNNNN